MPTTSIGQSRPPQLTPSNKSTTFVYDDESAGSGKICIRSQTLLIVATSRDGEGLNLRERMIQVILKRKPESSVSVEAAIALIALEPSIKVVHRSGDAMLIAMSTDDLQHLDKLLPGWIISPQRATVQVPNTQVVVGRRRDL